MFEREYHYRWVWRLQANPEQLWPLVSDTNRFNRDTFVPPIRQLPNQGRLENGRLRLRWRFFGWPLDREDDPFEWVRPYRFGVTRRFFGSPLTQMRTLTELAPRPEGGTTLTYNVWVQPRNLLGLVAMPVVVGIGFRNLFKRVMHRYDRIALESEPPEETPAPIASFSPGAHKRLLKHSEALLRQGVEPVLVERLLETIENGDDMALSHIRPYVLADSWHVRRRDILELCLRATRAGLLDLRWDLLCPLCRGAKESSDHLGGVQSRVHCDACNIDFDVNFDRSVELTFRPNRSVRHIESQEYCIAGPQVTPHVVIQQLLAPGETRTVTPQLDIGRYRIRALEMRGGQFFQVRPGGERETSLTAHLGAWPNEEPELAPAPTMRLHNATGQEQLFIIERLAWSDQAVTAAEVSALQLFRDLFANEALRPGEKIAVGYLTVLFTDLRGSTQLYRNIGDAPAFGLVMNHFDVLRDAIAAEHGAIVKTIGDAVMAVFGRPAAAMRAILHAQSALASPNDQRQQPLLLKVGIHAGPCIAVTLNERLDYFGTTVNLAARLEGLSSGGDVIISDSVYNDPEVAELLTHPDEALVAEPFRTTLKGFEDEHFELWRVALQAVRERSPSA